MLQGPLADGGELGGRVDGTGRVGGGAHEQGLGALGTGGLELVDRDLVVLVRAGEDLDGRAARQLDALGVGDPERGGEDDLVARVDDRGEGLVDGLLAAVGDDDVLGGDLVAGVAQGLGLGY